MSLTMDNLLRFSDYDVFAYLASGLSAMAVGDLLFGTNLVLNTGWSLAAGATTIVGAYILGQILAAPAAWVMEHGLVKSLLGTPSQRLIASERPQRGVLGLLATVFLREYFRPIERNFRDRVRANGAGAEGEGLFWQAYTLARADQVASARLEGFLRLYGFCRNIAFVALLATVAFGVKAIVGAVHHWPSVSIQQSAFLCGGSAIACLGMIHRYLKFHRLYTLEAFVVLARGTGDGGSS